MEPNDSQFEYGKPRNNFEQVWSDLFGDRTGPNSLGEMQKRQDAYKAKEQAETDEKFNQIIKDNGLDDKGKGK